MPHDPDQPTAATRRMVLVGGAVGAAAAIGSAPLLARGALAQSTSTTAVDPGAQATATSVGQRDASTGSGATTGTTVAASTTLPRLVRDAPGDLPVVLFARAIGFAGVEIYDRAGSVEFTDLELKAAVDAFRTQHLEAANTWSGMAAVPGDVTPNAALLGRLISRASGAVSETQALGVLIDLESIVAATLLTVLARLQATEAAALCAGLLSAAARRGAVLGQASAALLGDGDVSDYVPAIQTVSGAITIEEQA